MKYIKTYEKNYLSDDEIEEPYEGFVISDFKVDKLSDDGGASGFIEIYLPLENRFQLDYWIKYDQGPKIAFDKWYPENVSKKLIKAITKFIKEERLKQAMNKYNL